MSKRVVLPIAIIVIAILVFIALKQSKPQKAIIDKPEKVWRVDTVTVTKTTISPQITLYGRVETPRKASLNAAVTGYVEAVDVLEGSRVSKGQRLLKLDDSDVGFTLKQRQADLAEVEALINSEQIRYKRDINLLDDEKELLALADKAVNRAKKLEETKLVSRSSLDETLADKQRQVLTVKRLKHDIAEHPARLANLKAQRIRAEAMFEQAKLDLERTNITAPFNGRIAKLSVSIGDRVRVGDNLITVYDLDDLEVRAQIPSRYVRQIKQSIDNKKKLIATATVDGQDLNLRLNRLSGEIELDSGGIDGLFAMETDDLNLPLGTFVELTMTLQAEQNVISIPFNALYGLDKVFRLNDGYLEAVRVERVGEFSPPQGGSYLLVRSPQLRDQDKLVSTQLPNATTGLRIEALNDGA